MVGINTPLDIPGGIAIGLARRWWALAIRGFLAITFGILAFAMPVSGLLALVWLFGAFALGHGVLSVVAGFRYRRTMRHWGWLLFEGAVGIGVGITTLVWPGISALALLTLISAWAIVTGAAEILAAVRLHRELEGEWLLILSGVFSIVLGMLMFALPGAAAIIVVYWVASYAVVFGVLQVVLAFRLRRWAHGDMHHDVTGGMPHPA